MGVHYVMIFRLLSGVGSRLASARMQWQRSRLLSLDLSSGLGDSAWLLHGLVRALKPERVVEIGSARGASTCYIAQALRENGAGRLRAIDPHVKTEWNDEHSVDSYDQLVGNLRALRLEAYVEVIREFSHDVAPRWKDPIDLLFIDGDHSFEGVERDWKLFSPFVREFGFIVFHDTLWDRRPDPRWAREDMGVPSFVDQLRREGFPVITLDKNFGMSLVQPIRGGVPLGGEK